MITLSLVPVMSGVEIAFGIVTVVSLIAAVYFWRNPKQVKLSLGYEITENRPLFTPGGLESLRLLSFDVEVEHPWVTGLAIVNTGEGPINKEDFDGPVHFVFKGGVVFLQSQAVGNSELGYAGPGGPDGSEFYLNFEPQLLNQGERAEMVVLTDDKPEFVRVEGHVAGVPSIAPAVKATAELVSDTGAIRRFKRLATFEQLADNAVALFVVVLVVATILGVVSLVGWAWDRLFG